MSPSVSIADRRTAISRSRSPTTAPLLSPTITASQFRTKKFNHFSFFNIHINLYILTWSSLLDEIALQFINNVPTLAIGSPTGGGGILLVLAIYPKMKNRDKQLRSCLVGLLFSNF
ncbi:hypothetical protein A2U01_0007875 [Trifolium medium]|uniref:Uncharacterized protein n=1 Tax=Trifolium medium TaxID=97028 RepID=A0A392MI55_9FABA|nr:hypothetical protein [Trifolium medium]